jgi:hypothetical protein
MLKLTESGVAILGEAGLPAEDAARTWRALFGYTFGLAGLGGGEGEFEHGLELMLDGLEGRLRVAA